MEGSQGKKGENEKVKMQRDELKVRKIRNDGRIGRIYMIKF